MTLRTRLTAWYAGVFLIAGIALVALNYFLLAEWAPLQGGMAAVSATEPAMRLPGFEVLQTSEGIAAAELPANTLVYTAEQVKTDTMETVLWQSVIALLVAAVLAVWLGWVVAGRVLAPLHSITTTAHRLEAERLDERIELDGPPDELKQLADTFDGMLDRLASSFDSQKRFVANASHELRTPLAVQRTLIEVALAAPDASAEMRRLGAHLLDTNERSEKLIDGLLVLARSDRGLTSRELVWLDEVVDDEVEACAALASEKKVTFIVRTRTYLVEGDRVLIAQLVGNLLRNAVLYNHPGGTVLITLDRQLTVTNTGPTVPAQAVPGLFEPFRRLQDRTGTAGSGLGLSIARSVAKAHDGSVTARPNGGGGLVVEVSLPESGVRQPS
ncbi:Signal transduction histidine kinase [Lentzea fradiae]|uniref:histidine kinase n=1 Tax=Lentzea fradiae TaxID=200378 RepID=A0A1G7YXE4_9PSEU|nr:HAMP domain-containing sensor histidine kinase [Lentzea fradiae]SDH01198.1 Signal transduction histidine kinase [Lentzea fradiae]